ncbi:MAG: penicillin-binding protein 2 [Actinomycetota bacterium]
MRSRSQLNLLVVQIFVASLMFALVGRLFYLQIADGPRYQAAALDIQSRDIVTPALRGLIVDNEGRPMAINKAGLMITADRSVLDKQSDKGVNVLARTAAVLKLNYVDVFARTRLCGELPKGERNGCWNGNRYQPIPITKEATEDQVLTILEQSDLYPGIGAEPVSIRYYPSYVGERATHVLGYLGPITEADLNNEDGKRYYRNEFIGKAGVEVVYDQYLRGKAGIRTVIVDRKESVTQESRNIPSTPGNHLILNLNAKLQSAVELELKNSIARARGLGYRGDSGAAIVMDVKTGRVLAMASYPDYDLNIWENGITVKQSKELYDEKSGVPALSRAIQGTFAPASTFKVVSLSAAVDAGYDLKGTYLCPAEVQIGNRTFKNYDSKAAGRINLTTAMAISCDSIWYQIAYDEWVRDGGLKPKANPNDYFFKTAAGFGVGKKTGIDLPSELSGRLPNREWKQNWYDKNKDYYCNYEKRAKKSQLTRYLIELARENCIDGDKVRAGDMVNFSIGQGDTLMTPLQMAVMYSALANGGKLVVPQIARAIVTPTGQVVKEFEPEVSGTLPIDKTTLKFLQKALRAVVTSGTARGSFAGVGVEISGKTGTGQVFGRNLNGSAKDDTSWFASFAPSSDPQYAVVMMVSQGGFGASTSGVGVRKIYEHIFGTNGQAAIFPNGIPAKLPKVDATKGKDS